MRPSTQRSGIIFAAVATGVAIGVCAGGLATLFAKRVVTPAPHPPAPLEVLSVNRKEHAHTVTFTRGEDARLRGNYSFIFDKGKGHIRVGDVVREDAHSVERLLLGIDHGVLEKGALGRITGWWFARPEELGYPVEDVHIPADIGTLPAWRIAPEESLPGAVAIHVHGRGARREEVLRGVAPLAREGYTNLVMSYRNDPDAPPATGGRYGLGVTESQDVMAAIRFAVAAGATSIVLVGWSMGGTAVLIAAEQSEYRDLIVGLVLESPGIDWPDILRHQAQRSRVPQQIGVLGTSLIERGSRLVGLEASVRVSELTPDRFASTLRVPVLLIVSDEDTFVPATGALHLAHLRGDSVTLWRAPAGEHVKIWNVDPGQWEQQIEAFIATLA